MPEGPEVRPHADTLAAALTPHPLVSLTARTKVAKSWLAERPGLLEGRRVDSIRSRGKNLVGLIEGGYYFYSHLMMWGHWHVFCPHWVSHRTSSHKDNGALVVNKQASRSFIGSPPMNRHQRLLPVLFALFALFVLVRPAACQNANSRPLLSASNLKQIGLAVTMYMQDHNAKLPPMRSTTAAQKALRPYVKNDSFFRQPRTHEPYLPNPFFASRPLGSFDRPAEMVIYYEARPDPDGRRAVLFLDGHVKRIQESEWPALKAASHVPNVRPR